MKSWVVRMMLGAGAGAVVAALLLVETRPAPRQAVNTAQGVMGSEPPAVTESELELYIDVYSSMQSDHGLTIDEVLEPREMSLDEFRELERRIQRQDRLIGRVRKALLEHAKAHAASLAPATAEPGSGAAASSGNER